MYKITIKETLGEMVKETIIETDNLELAKEILVSEEILKVETDVPNENIDPGMTELRDLYKKVLEDMLRNPRTTTTGSDPLDPLKIYRDSGSWPFSTPFTVTC